MGEITAPRSRTNQRPLEGLPEGARLLERVARPLTGLEVKEALRRHLVDIGDRMLVDGKIHHLFEQAVIDRLGKDSRLSKMNLVYPGVGWKVTVVREMEGDGGRENLWAEIELDLEPGKRNNWIVGESGLGEELERIEEEQLQSRVPDAIREKRGLPVEGDWVKPSTGERGKVQFARRAEVGQAALEPIVVKRDEEGLSSPEKEKETTLKLSELPVVRTEVIKPKRALENGVLDIVHPPEMPVEDLVGELPKDTGAKVPRKVSVLGTVDYSKSKKAANARELLSKNKEIKGGKN